LLCYRHGQSTWNITEPSLGLTARFTGWVDVDLTSKGVLQAQAAGKCLKMFGIKPDAIYTSLLKRSIISLNEMDIVPSLQKEGHDVTVINSWRLNERHYGMLTGMPKATAGQMLGEEKVSQWRRSWDQAPPPLHREDHMDLTIAMPAQPKTIITSRSRRLVATEKYMQVPCTESLLDCAKRVLPLWHKGIAPRVSRGETVLVVAHANSIRSLLKCIDSSAISETSIRNISIPSAIPLVYDFVVEEGSGNLSIDEIPNPLDPQCTSEEGNAGEKAASVFVTSYISHLKPIGSPSRLGVRGQYIANKDLVRLHLESNEKSASSINETAAFAGGSFYDLVGRGFRDLVRFSDYGEGKKDALVITDGQGVIVHSNDAWSALCGFTRDEVMGKTNAVLQGPLTNANDTDRLNEKLYTGLPSKGHAVNYRKSGVAFMNDFTVIPVYSWLNQPPETASTSSSSSSILESQQGVGISSSSIPRQNLKPSYFVAKLEQTPDRYDLPGLSDEEIEQRDRKHTNSSNQRFIADEKSSSSEKRLTREYPSVERDNSMREITKDWKHEARASG
jgi:2,3-bisphosphoglycerate-dependent phosphoglycerate mutase